MADPVWFWQRIVSPHMVELAKALAATGRQVTYVAEREMSDERAAQGWRAPPLAEVQLRLAPTASAMQNLVREAPARSIHICQGFRGNGLVNVARQALRAKGLRQWVVTEGVDDDGWRGQLKRVEYRRLLRKWRTSIEGVLSIGHATRDWLIKRGMPSTMIFPFAYFLAETSIDVAANQDESARPFQLIFVGRLVPLKRVTLLLEAIQSLSSATVELSIVGSGPMERKLRAVAGNRLPGRVRWLGNKSPHDIPLLMAEADCLVLPSRHDGWGAVVSEALMVGTPVVCSDTCGAAGVVEATGQGGIFRSGDRAALADLLGRVVAHGHPGIDERRRLGLWARCLGARAGADYLNDILAFADGAVESAPPAPWRRTAKNDPARSHV